MNNERLSIDILYEMCFAKDEVINCLLHDINRFHPELLDKELDLYKRCDQYARKMISLLDKMEELNQKESGNNGCI